MSRKVGCDFCSAQGLSDELIKIISKHSRTDIFGKSYRSPICIPVKLVLAGFKPGEIYFVPRAQIQLPEDLNLREISIIFFPDLEIWEREILDDNGDKDKGARHFILVLVPYFTKVILQDGVYWVHLFPNNPAVQLLLNCLDGHWVGNENYSNWARDEARARDRGNEGSVDDGGGQNENTTARQYEAIIQRQQTQINNMCSQMQRFLDERMRANGNVAAQQEPQQALVQGPPAVQEPVQEPVQKPLQRGVVHLRNFNQRRKPTVLSLNQYGTIRRLVEAWEEHHHYMVDDISTNKQHEEMSGCKSPKMTFSKIKRIHRKVQDCVRELHSNDANVTDPAKMLEAAEWLDANEKLDQTIAKYGWVLNNNTLEIKGRVDHN